MVKLKFTFNHLRLTVVLFLVSFEMFENIKNQTVSFQKVN